MHGAFLFFSLGMLAQTTTQRIRSTDYAFRMGGEEFILVLKGASSSVANEQAEFIRKKFEQMEFELEGKTINVTASFGVATLIHRSK